MVSCGVTLSVVGFVELRKPQVVLQSLSAAPHLTSLKKMWLPEFALLYLFGY
jgi:hypothetical protein